MRRPPVASLAVVFFVVASLCMQGTATATPLAPTSVEGWGGAPTSVSADGVYSASVRVDGGAREVWLQRHGVFGWETVDTARTDRRGRATITWVTPVLPQAVRLRVHVPGTGTRAGATTAGRRVIVRTHVVDSLMGSVLALVNVARATARSCGGDRFPAVPPLRRNARLDAAADRFAHLMATRDFFAHESPNGADPGDRIRKAGYDWRSYGENIAAGYPTPAEVVAGWLDSPGHCRNLMGRFTEIGLGYAHDPDSTYGSYWVQDFASR